MDPLPAQKTEVPHPINISLQHTPKRTCQRTNITPYRHILILTLSTHSIIIPYQHMLSSYPMNTLHHYTLSTHAILIPYEHTPSLCPINTFYPHTLSTHSIHTPYQYTLSLHHINTLCRIVTAQDIDISGCHSLSESTSSSSFTTAKMTHSATAGTSSPSSSSLSSSSSIQRASSAVALATKRLRQFREKFRGRKVGLKGDGDRRVINISHTPTLQSSIKHQLCSYQS